MPFFGDATDGAVLMLMIDDHDVDVFERLEQRLRPPPSRVSDYGPLSGKQRALQRENGMPCIAIYCDRLSLSRRRLPFKSPFRSNHYLVRFLLTMNVARIRQLIGFGLRQVCALPPPRPRYVR